MLVRHGRWRDVNPQRRQSDGQTLCAARSCPSTMRTTATYCVRHQARLHDVLAALQAPVGARAVVYWGRGHAERL
jgi:hypothetical protein